ncbi:tRNA delta(2)-isopentenylpyrophosphate transferase [Dinoroseobacter shibae DFL 12 = DSM 16493]|jgi:tRNA dimethylallyltransferase|uniref:tRNA dimethylallyltransferase n=1 Tax=Dinoroseobacter shibae (strain DSM 16493 / NCIMB 14021 / DFL 12) TaxID=398580 RepID=MIAA_DINSH|nr:tRNA (adenosine(37)-N6)-dimethylallyltransferase MiaA [Dinoroseobacter shibae]A8LK35.1 RecName: Full=tRNA dimethylallyltransferase; AltName: Full=Dimethylallyl diphosphate:tRNA dimethylallyltransferase; Short=DMAPP:tRNA dimethylallyltransferase; Short=DMATase; AltName: Full=Isopentenyl-diphosphate:tRNA isopentenyltransferase; Short=IPP transferase; Short=IPPT; Short=IPTase [Dinoroseobacter shibae DFL 12 = DSM 16493]ABV93234.1 tRNA delta(2)-isopentenylpyrophosphate transferase [Dinoroseobacter 
MPLPDLSTLSADQPVLIAGPTASGKSALALRIAERQGGVIVNADALQVHHAWRVLTARPSPQDEARAPHRLYGHVARGTPHSVGHWLREVTPLLSGQRPIIVGGTGLFFTALTQGLSEIPEVPAEVRARADALREGDFARMQADLGARDPETSARIDMANPMRVQRAWEVLETTGRPLARWQADTPPPLLPRSRAARFVLEAPKDWLAPRIARRFRQMLDQGALDEARAALPHWDAAAPWARAIGAPELIAHLRGEITLDAAEEAATRATRQYAKRQRTWFRARMRDWTPVPPGSA